MGCQLYALSPLWLWYNGDMAAKKETFVILDGNALIHRAFHALPPLTTKTGEVVNAVYGFASILLKVLKELRPTYIAATFDLAAPTFRHKEYEKYKATRVKAPQDLYDQIPRVKEVVRAFNIPTYEQEGFEADDLIGTVTRKLHGEGLRTIIVTGDMDTLQLVSDDTHVYTMRKGVGETTEFGPAEVKERYGLTPEQMIDYKALRGDPSDNIPGVPGIGEKTATELLQTFGTLDKLYEAVETGSKKLETVKPRIIELLKAHKKEAELSKKLGTIVRNVPIHFVLNDARAKSYHRQQVVDLFQELEFKSLLSKLPTMTLFQQAEAPAEQPALLKAKKDPRKDAHYTVVDDDASFAAFLKKLKTVHALAVDTETTAISTLDARLLGISLSWKVGEAYYVNINHPDGEKRLKELAKILENAKIKKFGHNMKYDLKILSRSDVRMRPLEFDTMIASYLINPGSRQHNLDTVVFSEFGYEMQPITDLIGKSGKDQLTMDRVPLEQLGWYSCEDADFTFRLVEKLGAELEAKGGASLMQKIEMPLIPVLAEMELTGITVDAPFLSRMSKKTKVDLAKLEKGIYKAADTEFNINSPIQLKEVLFHRLKISTQGVGKTKTGFSTAAAELEKMKDAHPIIPMMLEYRELAKLLSTYLDALPALVHPSTGRVHTEYNQVVAATGRLSSSNPNLQNIPVRTELGREIRKAFVAAKGCVLLSADYSQIELRLAAALSGDKKMLEAFRKGEDIHARTAADIHGIPLDKVTKDIRFTAKEVNFGVLYGMGVYGLASRTGITREHAKEFIEKYFSVYKGVAAYVEETKALAKSRGYVETLFGRRRYLPEINSGMQQL
ncbi:MAG: DNA polymerase I, partial [Candidatus Kerfeldbacteria bacterium]|nr:DNA polymerase I [Candidatus Kerfeldbacteria bacterium]